MEEMGTPTVSLVNKGFMNDARSAASSKGWPSLRFVAETVPSECSVAEQIEDSVEAVMDDIVAGLSRPLSPEEASPKAKEGGSLSRIVFKGTLS